MKALKGIVVTTSNVFYERRFDDPLYKTVGEVVGGDIEIVYPRGLEEPLCMIVNDEGRLIGLPINPCGCGLYGTWRHGSPIVGDLVIMKHGYRNGEPDIVGLSDEEATAIMLQLESYGLKKEGE